MHGHNEKTFKRRRTYTNEMIENENNNTTDKVNTQPARMADSETELEEGDNHNYRELTEGDLYTQLALRESDLSLAKEVGQALLAENVELRKKYDSLLDLHTSQVEELKQEKHALKRSGKELESLQDEKIHELQIDLENLQNELRTFEEATKNDERSRRQNVSDLTEENAKLNCQLTKVNNSNKELLTEINRLQRMQREKNPDCTCKSQREETEALRQKLITLEQEREFLDTSINKLVTDKEEFSKEVNRLTQKVISLTEELADSKSELSLCEEELNSSKKENLKLHEQLDEVKLQTSQHIALSGSIFSEISMLENEADFSMQLAESPSCRRIKQVASLHGTPKPLAASSSTNLLKPKDQSPLEHMSQSSSDDGSSDGEDGFVLKQHGYFAQLEQEQKANMELRKEMFAVCHQLLQAFKLVTHNTYETKQTFQFNLEEHYLKDDVVVGTLTMISAELIGHLKEYVAVHEIDQDETMLKEEQEYQQEKLMTLEKQVEDLTTECFEAKKQLSSLGAQLEQSRKETNQKEEEMSRLLENIAKQESEIKNLRRRSSLSSSRLQGSLSMMDELERAKMDVKNLDNQLRTAIGQKIKLSEQLEQWQYDMASVIEEQVQKQLKTTLSERDHSKRRPSRLPFVKKGWMWTS